MWSPLLSSCSAGAGEIRRGTKSSAGFFGFGGSALTGAGAGAEPSTGAIRRGIQFGSAFGRDGRGAS